eukprot:gene28535-36798_t
MSMHSHINFSIDESRKLIVAGINGNLSGEEINRQLSHQLSQIDAPWSYELLVDARAFSGSIRPEESDELAKRWALQGQGRDKGGLIAIVSEEPHLDSRHAVRASAFPARTASVFAKLDAAMEWLRQNSRHR